MSLVTDRSTPATVRYRRHGRSNGVQRIRCADDQCLGGSHRNIAMMFGMKKTRMVSVAALAIGLRAQAPPPDFAQPPTQIFVYKVMLCLNK